MKFPIYYLVSGTQGAQHQRDGLDVSFTGSVANVTVNDGEQYDKFWAGRIAYLKNAAATDVGQLS